MPHARSTVDTWELHVNYGQGWEHETTEFTLKDAREQRKTYRDNCPEFPTKLVRRRVRKADLTPGMLRDIAAARKRLLTPA